MEEEHPARALWRRYEPVHAVAYFAPEVTDAYKAAGLKGFWMGYFAGRSAAFGSASAELVAATFFNFHESLVTRALPDAWRFASPQQVLEARATGVDEALRSVLGQGGSAGAELMGATELVEAAELAAEATRGCTLDGRPLFAAHASLPWPDSPHLRLWHACTLLREHRGDGHVAACLAEGLSGLGAHITLSASGAVPADIVQRARGWSVEDWDAASDGLASAGILERGRGADSLTPDGLALRDRIESMTDRLASEPLEHLGPERTARLAALLAPIAGAIEASGVIPYPNPMGLPASTASG